MRGPALGLLALVSLLALPPSEGPPGVERGATALQPSDSAAILAHARASADSFVRLWRYDWEVSERFRHMQPYRGPTPPPPVPSPWDPPAGATTLTLTRTDSLRIRQTWVTARERERWARDPVGFQSVLLNGSPFLRPVLHDRVEQVGPRKGLMHCHPGREPGFEVFDGYIISSGVGKETICPSWYVGGGPPGWDERSNFDGSIVAMLRDGVSAARATLLRELDSAGGALPGDDWLAGQRVRFALDQLDTASAVRAASTCRGSRWWCTALGGYLLALNHQTTRADSAFSAMLDQMSGGERCAWTDLSALLDDDGRLAYSRISCASRDSANARIWWLSDPAYTEVGNDRRVEHYARRVLIALRSATTFNERWDMRPEGGGGAVTAMLLRYGWPSLSYWGGRDEDLDHFGYLGLNSRRAGDSAFVMQSHGRFATAEYAGTRFGTVPSWEAIANPWAADEGDWELTAEAHRELEPGEPIWWPIEHYSRSTGPLVQLASQQGVFRRQDGALLAIGVGLPPEDLGGARGDTLRGSLVISTAPDSMAVSNASAVVGVENQIRVMVPSHPAVVSLELFGTRPAGVIARSRFGIDPPPPLSAMRPGEIAITPPVLVRSPGDNEPPPTDPDAALARMLGRSITDWSHVGFYWETYGIRAGEVVDVSLRFERREAPGVAAARLNARLGAAPEGQGAVTFTWREPDAGTVVVATEGVVPIQGRNVTLDLSQLGPANYTLTVSVARPGQPPVEASRDFRVTNGTAIPSVAGCTGQRFVTVRIGPGSGPPVQVLSMSAGLVGIFPVSGQVPVGPDVKDVYVHAGGSARERNSTATLVCRPART